MSTLNEQLYIDGVVVYGTGRKFTVKIKQPTQQTASSNNPTWENMDLTLYSVLFTVFGSATGDGTRLVQKLITQTSDENTVGIIEEPTSGEFTFVITPEDTRTLGLGGHPIMLQLLDAQTLEPIFTLTEGGVAQSEFNKITVVRV